MVLAKRKRSSESVKDQENGKASLNNIKHRRLENSREVAKVVKNKKKEKQIGFEGKKGDIGIKLELKNEEIKKENENIGEDIIRELSLLDLPAELIEAIVSYLTFKEATILRQINHYFYEFVTGYNQVGLEGIENRPARAIKQAAWSLKHHIDFNRIKDKLATMPSFVFYQLIREVKNLSIEYWPHLEKTQVHTIYLGWNKLGPEELEMLGRYLQKSKVGKIYLWRSQIDDKGAEVFGKTLVENNSMREVNLARNKLGAIGAKGFTEYLPVTIRVINLRENCIGDIGAIDVARNVRNKEIEEINLGQNRIGDKGIIGVIENLQDSLMKRLYLGNNNITDVGAMEAAEGLGRTNLEEISVGYNKITNKGAIKIVKHCRGTKMKKLNLCFNRGITDEGAVEIAEHVVGTVLEEIDLRQYKPRSAETQELLKTKCPYINWIFY